MEKVQKIQPVSKKAYIEAMTDAAEQILKLNEAIYSMGWLDSMDRPDLFEIMHSLDVAEDLIRDMVCRLKCRGDDEAEN
jgi:hypothetical protein